MFRFSTAKKGWLDSAGGTNDTNRTISGPATPATEMTIALKLKERLKQARDNIALKKQTNPESLMTEQTHIIEPTIAKAPSDNDSDDEGLKIPLHLNREEGFTERFDEQNELQRRARNTMSMLKKNAKKREPTTRNAQATPQNIPILNYHYQSGPGMALPSTNLRHMAIFDMSQEAKKAINEEKYNMKIDDPNSVLHIANYHQNKDFDQYAKVIIEENKQFLKINAPDVFTFFRLHHELHEMNRKKQRFVDMKTKFFDNKDPEEIIQYDENLDNFDAITAGKKKEMVDKKEYQYAEEMAKKLKETGKKKDLKSLEKNFAYGLMGNVKESKAKFEGKF